MDLVIYWTFVINTTKSGVIKTSTESILSDLGNKDIFITKSEIYWKDKSKYLLEFKQILKFIPTIELATMNLIENIEKINSNWSLNIVSLTKENFDVSATTDKLRKDNVSWAGFSSEIIFPCQA